MTAWTNTSDGARGRGHGQAFGSLEIGSLDHRDLFCQTIVETHVPYDPATITWPDLTPDARARLVALPFWHEAVSVESFTAKTVADAVQLEDDAAIREAIALQGAEEARHSALLRAMFDAYGIAVADVPPPPDSRRPMWDFCYSGMGECFDSFFAFGLFALARQTEFLPPPLIEVFEPVMQEEVRHIQFFVNWAAYRRARAPLLHRPAMRLRIGAIVIQHALSRVKTARELGQPSGDAENFTLSGHKSFATDLSLRTFLDLCLAENARRFSVYDPRLLQPRLVPRTIRAVRSVLPR